MRKAGLVESAWVRIEAARIFLHLGREYRQDEIRCLRIATNLGKKENRRIAHRSEKSLTLLPCDEGCDEQSQRGDVESPESRHGDYGEAEEEMLPPAYPRVRDDLAVEGLAFSVIGFGFLFETVGVDGHMHVVVRIEIGYGLLPGSDFPLAVHPPAREDGQQREDDAEAGGGDIRDCRAEERDEERIAPAICPEGAKPLEELHGQADEDAQRRQKDRCLAVERVDLGLEGLQQASFGLRAHPGVLALAHCMFSSIHLSKFVFTMLQE